MNRVDVRLHHHTPHRKSYIASWVFLAFSRGTSCNSFFSIYKDIVNNGFSQMWNRKLRELLKVLYLSVSSLLLFATRCVKIINGTENWNKVDQVDEENNMIRAQLTTWQGKQLFEVEYRQFLRNALIHILYCTTLYFTRTKIPSLQEMEIRNMLKNIWF